jgi:uncharacterized YccA/Bax inhibitor family protein
MSILSSSNPVLSDSALDRLVSETGGVAQSDTASITGVLRKTSLCTMLAVAAGAGGYLVTQAYPSAVWISAIGAFVVSLVLFFVMMSRPHLAKIGAPVYSITQGFFLGAFSMMLEGILASKGIVAMGGLALQAFVITGSLMATMLALHTFGIIKAGPRFASILSLVTIGIGVVYLVSFIMSLFGASMPFLSLGSAFDGGSAALIGLGINALILIVAALWLLVDFAQIDEAVAAGAPKSMEWMLAFGLIVTLAWIYYEALKMAFRLAALFGNRE